MKNRIQELRHQKGITIQDLAQALGIRTQILSEYELGILPLTDEVLRKIAEYFDVPVGCIIYAE